MINNLTLVGRLTRDPELRYTKSSMAVCSFTLAVDREMSKEKREEADENETIFDANSFKFEEDGFCYLEFNEEDEYRFIACISMSEIKYLVFVEVEE